MNSLFTPEVRTDPALQSIISHYTVLTHLLHRDQLAQNVNPYPHKRIRGGSVNELLAPSEPQSDSSSTPQARLTKTVTDWQNLDAKLLGLQEAQPEISTHCPPHESDTTEHLNYPIFPSHESAPPFSEHLSPRTTLLPGPSLPLTRHNLCQLNDGMSDPKTPEKTSSKSTTLKTKSSASLKVGPVRQLLKLNNMLFDSKQATGNALAKTFAEAIVMSPRDSPDRPQAGQELAELMRKYSHHNESTLMHQWFHPLVKDDRQPNQGFHEQGAGAVDGDEEESASVLNPDGVWRLFRADGLDSSWDKEFRRNSIPQLNHPDKKALAALLKDLPRLVNPKPDITYGYDNDSFTDEQQLLNFRHSPVAKISDAIDWPFFIVEAKLGGMDAVQNQCIRSGSALVHSIRRLLQEYDIAVNDISDESTVFTLAITTGSAYIHVHWAEKRADGTMAYHMKSVSGFSLGFEPAQMDLRKAINNILDWGLLRRKHKIDKMLEVMLAKTEGGKRAAPSPSSAETSSKQAKTQG
ncbi:MAG: hypothetical protein LQ338_007827 [Usnochroma carphineum]|nr:MAG: hypothetical protein LQ338_007827 [Usnochroma carphineum]